MPVYPPLAKPRDDIDYITADSIWNQLGNIAGTYANHEAGIFVANGAQRHNDTHIDMTTIDDTVAPTQSPTTQHGYNNSTYAAFKNWLAGFTGATFMARLQDATTRAPYFNVWQQLLNHNHHDATHGGQLNQADTHQNVDTDGVFPAIHHTIGAGANQAAAGNHVHTGPQTYSGSGTTPALYARNASGDPAQTIFAVQSNSGGATYFTVTPAGVSVAGSTTLTGNLTQTGNQSVNGTVTATAFSGAFNGLATGIVAGGITLAMMGVDSVDNTKIKDGSVGNAELAPDAITTDKILNGTILGADIHANTITGGTTGNIAADTITATEIATGAIGNAELAANAVTADKILDGTIGTTELAVGAVTGDRIANGAITDINVQIGSLGIAVLSEGLVHQEGATGSHNVVVNATRTWNSGAVPVNFPGAVIDLTSYIPDTAGTYLWALIYVNDAPAARVKQGPLMYTTYTDAGRPPADVGTTPLAYVLLNSGHSPDLTNNPITNSDIQPWRGPQPIGGGTGGSSGGGFSDKGHDHGRGAEIRISSYGLKEGWVHSIPNQAVLGVQVESMRYVDIAGVSKQTGITSFTTQFTIPAFPNYRVYPLFLRRSADAYIVGASADLSDPNATPPAFSLGDCIPLAYVYIPSGTPTTIKDQNDNTGNGWIVDARTWQGGSSGVGGVGSPITVSQGGTGQTTFNQGLIYQPTAGTGNLQVVPTLSDTFRGLALQPTLNGPSGSSPVASVELGGGAINNGTTTMARMMGTHLVPPIRTGSVNANEVVAVQVDLPSAGGGTYASAIFAGAVRVGNTNMPGPTYMLDVAGNVNVSGSFQAASVQYSSLNNSGQTILQGNTRVGSNVAPTRALDVHGQIGGDLGIVVSGATSTFASPSGFAASVGTGGLQVTASGIDVTGASTFRTTAAFNAGLTGTTGNFSGQVNGSTGVFTGAVSGTSGSFSTTLGVNGLSTLTGGVNTNALTASTGSFAGNVTLQNGVSLAAVNGSISVNGASGQFVTYDQNGNSSWTTMTRANAITTFTDSSGTNNLQFNSVNFRFGGSTWQLAANSPLIAQSAWQAIAGNGASGGFTNTVVAGWPPAQVRRSVPDGLAVMQLVVQCVNQAMPINGLVATLPAGFAPQAFVQFICPSLFGAQANYGLYINAGSTQIQATQAIPQNTLLVLYMVYL
jgi:hypothetical protein